MEEHYDAMSFVSVSKIMGFISHYILSLDYATSQLSSCLCIKWFRIWLFFFHSFWDHSVIHNSMNDEATNQTCILLNFFKLLRDDMNIKMLYIMCSFWLLEHDFGMQTNFLILKLQSNFLVISGYPLIYECNHIFHVLWVILCSRLWSCAQVVMTKEQMDYTE